ncbi:MAG: DUF2794 domain-containing protein, partial [Brevundimonas sp.]
MSMTPHEAQPQSGTVFFERRE